MTLKTTKANLQKLLADRENRVIALSGLWGTGKSHLWDEARKTSSDTAVKNSLYVSLFGIGDMAQLKLKLVQSAIPVAGKSNLATDMAKTAWREGTKILRSLNAGFAALDELALLAVPAMLRNRFIVIDDIERKHEKLSIDEVMGFIDEFTQQYGSRILLILNTDQLADRAVWEKLREKVIDQEILLDTSTDEAFDIAVKLTSSIYEHEIRKSIEACRITNIRVIRKIIRSVNRILSSHEHLTSEVVQRVIPSTVLLSAIHYKGIIDGPDVEYVLCFNSMVEAISRADKKEKNETMQSNESDKQRSQWALLMDRLGISSSDEYELLLSDFLTSGSLEIDAINKILDRYTKEAGNLAARRRMEQFFERTLWHPELSDAELVADATPLVADAALFDPTTITALHTRLQKIDGGSEVANQIVAAWISDYNLREDKGAYDQTFSTSSFHPEISAALKAAETIHDSTRPLAEVCSSIVNRQAWGRREEAAMKAASVADFEASIRSLVGHELKMFMLQNMDLYAHRGTYENHFGQAMENFVEACRRICVDTTSARLGKLIRLVFEDAKLASNLEPKMPPQASVTLELNV